MNKELILMFRMVTGWSDSQVIDELKKVSCNYTDALNVYKAAGRLPDQNECDFLNEAGFDAWFSLWQRGLSVNSR